MTEAEQEIARLAAEAGMSTGKLRRMFVDVINVAETDTSKGLPLMMSQDESHRLYGIAHAAALQAVGGANDHQVDVVADKLFRILAATVGRNNASYADRRESVRLVQD